jgi:ribosomal protein L11 methylase PrmA
MLVEFMTSVDKNKTILDVGCGEGLLVDFLHKCGYEHYFGFDFSDVALQNAAKRADSKTVFTKGFVESFVLDGHRIQRVSLLVFGAVENASSVREISRRWQDNPGLFVYNE